MYQSNSNAWSALNAIIEIENGYLAGGATDMPYPYNWHQITLMILNEQGEKIDERFIGDTISEYYIAVNSFVKINNDNIVFSGSRRTYLPDFPHDEALLVMLNNEYDTLWSKFYGESVLPFDSAYNSRQLIETSDNDLVMIGTMVPEINYKDNAFLIKTDHEGNKLSECLYTYPDSDWKLRGFSVIETPDKGFAIGAYRFKPGYPFIYTGEPMVYKVDSLGNEEWNLDIGSPHSDDKAMLCNAHDGNIIAATCYADSMSGTEDAYRRVNIEKIDLEGNIVWDKKYGYSRLYHYIGNIRLTNDGGYIVTGSMGTASLSIYLPWESGWVFKINGEGDSLWYRYKYNLPFGEDMNYLYDIIPTSDNGFTACGQVFGPSTNYTQHSWVVKMDSMGCDTPGCATGTQVFELPASEVCEMQVWPNPVNDMLRVSCSGFGVEGEKAFRLYNSQGVKVKELNVPYYTETITIDVSNYSSGLYYLQFVNSNKIVYTTKFIKT